MTQETDIAILNERQEYQQKELSIMKEEFKEFKRSLYSLTSSINSIKWVALGAGGVYLVNELGLVPVLKAIIL